MPKEVVHRPKTSFTLPLRSWIGVAPADMVDDYVLSSKGLSGRPRFDPKMLGVLLREERERKKDNAQRIWQLLTFEQWFRNHGV